MKEYVLDANAVLRYFGVGKGLGGDKVAALFVEAESGKIRLFISAVNLGEVFYVLLKYGGEHKAIHSIQAMMHAVTLVDADGDRALKAATMKHQNKLGYADSFAAALALERRAMLVSADPDFEKVGKALKWLRLPKFEAKRN